MNDGDLEGWVNNDEFLYHWWEGSKLSMRAFIRQNRKELTSYINQKLNRRTQDAP